MIDPIWGLAPEFLDNPSLGAVVTPWKIIFTRPEYLNDFASILCKGIPLGEAVAKFNQSENNRSIGLKLCLLGDPGLIFPGNPDADLLKKKLTIKRPLNVSLTITKELSFLRNHLRCIAGKKQASLVQTTSRALDSLETYENLLSKGTMDLAAEEKMRKDIIEVLIEAGTEAIVDYVGLVKKLKLQKKRERCFVCSSDAEIFHSKFHLPNIDTRIISICSCCGIIKESSSVFPNMEFKVINQKVIELKTEMRFEKWSASLLLHYKLKEQTRSFPWPSNEDGSPVLRFDTGIHWPEGPVYITLFFMIETKLAILRCPARGISD
jgi:hypothetical protein